MQAAIVRRVAVYVLVLAFDNVTVGRIIRAMLLGAGATVVIRALASHFRWNLPRVKDETL